MKPENEFTKPLRSRRAEEDTKSSSTLIKIVVGLILLFGLPIFHFYDGYSKVVAYLTPEKPEPQIVVVEKAPEHDANQAASQNQNNQGTSSSDGIEREGNVIRIQPQEPTIQKAQPKPIRRQEPTFAHLPDPELIERGATGVIPRRSPDGLRPMDVYSRQPDTEGNFGVARVVLIIGGIGISQTSTQQAIQNLPANVTLAFAPYGNSLTRWAQQARKKGHELLLQIPMEPKGYPENNPGQHTLRTDVDLQENLVNLHWSMSRITNYVGVMNYLGNSLLTEPAALTPLFSEIAERGLLFVDDGTVNNSVAEGAAVKALLPFAKGQIVIDNVRSRAAIAEKLDQLSKQAKRSGLAIGVGNAFPDTIAMVSEFARRAKEAGIEITPVSSIARDPSR